MRITITLPDEIVEVLDRKRAELGYTRSMYIEMALKGFVPEFLANRELIEAVGDLDASLRAFIISGKGLTDVERLELFTKLDKLKL